MVRHGLELVGGGGIEVIDDRVSVILEQHSSLVLAKDFFNRLFELPANVERQVDGTRVVASLDVGDGLPGKRRRGQQAPAAITRASAAICELCWCGRSCGLLPFTKWKSNNP